MHALPDPQPEHAFLCAWCDGVAASPLLPPDRITHGICHECLRRCTEGVRCDAAPDPPGPPLPP